MRSKALYRWPRFTYVRVLSKEETEPGKAYELICSMVKEGQYAYLVEGVSLTKFIDQLGHADEENQAINLHALHIAYNFKFPLNSVRLICERRKKSPFANDFADLLRFILNAPHEDDCRVKIEKLTAEEQSVIRREILQQFVYLNIFLPVATDNPKAATNKPVEVAVVGTKKAGKSALIDALLGGEYAPFSTLTPTPNRVLYSSGNMGDDVLIRFRYNNGSLNFDKASDLREHMEKLFQDANEISTKLDEMQVYIKDYPQDLKEFVFADTPGPNFAGAKEHESVTMESIKHASTCLFVLNYSGHLTNDEVNLFDYIYKSYNYRESDEPLLVAVNKIDEMYADSEIKSTVRIADYIGHRLREAGYDNVVVLPVSGILSVYLNKVASVLPDKGMMSKIINQVDSMDIENETLSNLVDTLGGYIKGILNIEKENLDKDIDELRKVYKNSDYISAIRFIDKAKQNAELFHNMDVDTVDVLEEFSGIKMLTCYIRHVAGNQIINDDSVSVDDLVSKISMLKDNLVDGFAVKGTEFISKKLKDRKFTSDKLMKIKNFMKR